MSAEKLFAILAKHNIAIGLVVGIGLGIVIIIVHEQWQSFTAATNETTEVVYEESVVDLAVMNETVATSTPSTTPAITEIASVPAVTPVVATVEPVSTPTPVVVPTPDPIVEPTTPANTADVLVSSAQKQTILTGHNTVRTKKGLSTLTWSESIAQSAQRWADYLATQECALEHSDGPYGENLYYEWTTGDTYTVDPKSAVRWWLDEEQYYDYGENTCEPGEQCGHYTQAVWSETTEIGCAVSLCSGNNRNTQLWVCQYNPPGNDGSRPY